MFNSNRLSLNLFFGVSISAMLLFQNCGQTNGFEVLDSDALQMASEIGDTSEQDHMGGRHDFPEALKPVIDYSPMLMNRIALYSVLSDVFGPEGSRLAAVTRVSRDFLAGAPCSIYDNFRGNTDSRKTCTIDEDAIGANVHVGSSILRQAMMSDACMAAVSNTKSLNYVIAQLKEGTELIPQSNDANITKLFRLFYRGKPDPQKNLIEYMKLQVGQPATAEGWKNAVYTTCASGYWQVL